MEHLSDSDTFCQRCFQEIFLYYLPPDFKKKRGVVCIFCVNRDDSSKKKKIEIPILYRKYEEEWIDELIKFSSAPNIMNHQ